ncbi:hypothetical protein [Neobacillus niacini]|nr:hypothetical protein [Neobacillus niacini]
MFQPHFQYNHFLPTESGFFIGKIRPLPANKDVFTFNLTKY